MYMHEVYRSMYYFLFVFTVLTIFFSTFITIIRLRPPE